MQMFRANPKWYVVVDRRHISIWREGRRGGNFRKGRLLRENLPRSIHGLKNAEKMGELTWFS
jgi:hypothetical protein